VCVCVCVLNEYALFHLQLICEDNVSMPLIMEDCEIVLMKFLYICDHSAVKFRQIY